jgi:uncharacterized surface protein with fasciclin (FAS1) repeats
LVEAAVSSGFLSTLVKAVEKAGLVETLKGEGPFTVFAPSDEAFAKIAPKKLDALLRDRAKLTETLTYHVIPGLFDSVTLRGVNRLNTVQGSPLPIDTRIGIKVGDAHVIRGDIHVRNGVIHVIDSVLSPGKD